MMMTAAIMNDQVNVATKSNTTSLVLNGCVGDLQINIPNGWLLRA